MTAVNDEGKRARLRPYLRWPPMLPLRVTHTGSLQSYSTVHRVLVHTRPPRPCQVVVHPRSNERRGCIHGLTASTAPKLDSGTFGLIPSVAIVKRPSDPTQRVPGASFTVESSTFEVARDALVSMLVDYLKRVTCLAANVTLASWRNGLYARIL